MLTDKVVLITGAASGIGAATAVEVAAQGGVVVLVDCDAPPLAIVAKRCGPLAQAWVADVADMSAIQAVVDAVLLMHGRIDVVFANAGIAAFGPVAHVDPDAWWRCMEVNTRGVFNTVRSSLPAVKRQQGYVLLNVSMSALAHPPVMSAYAASKAAVEAMGNAWHIELLAHDVAVGMLYAGWVRTPLVSEGALHPAFVRLRQTIPSPLNKEVSPAYAAQRIVKGMQRRSRRIWIPGWLRMLFAIRSLLNTSVAQRALVDAAPELEHHYLEGMAQQGTLASSFGPRERARSLARIAAASNPSGHAPREHEPNGQ